jgi:hypothetical protein
VLQVADNPEQKLVTFTAGQEDVAGIGDLLGPGHLAAGWSFAYHWSIIVISVSEMPAGDFLTDTAQEASPWTSLAAPAPPPLRLPSR